MKTVMVLACCLVSSAWCVSTASAETLVAKTSTWKYLHPTDGKDPAETDEDFHTTFATLDFDDSKWSQGTDSTGPHGGFGYGDEDFEGVDLKQPEDRGDRKSAYFRLKFKTTADFEKLVLKCQFDDAVIVYLDGKEVARKNVTEGIKDAYDLFAEETVGGDAETEVHEIELKGGLSAGQHVLAISVHNRPQGSSDLRLAEVSLESAE